MQPIKLGRITVHKVHEMDSPTPLLMQLPGVTAADLARLKRWYDPGDDELTDDPETSRMTFGVHSFVIEVDGQTILVDTYVRLRLITAPISSRVPKALRILGYRAFSDFVVMWISFPSRSRVLP